MRLLPLCLMAAMSLWLAGCLAESEQPIAPPDPTKADPRLWGSWLSVQEDGYMVAHIFATEAGGLQVALAEHDVEGIGKVDTYDGHATRLSSGDYLNVMVTGSETGYVIGKYQIEGTDRLSVWFPEDAKLVQAVQDGALPGTTKDEGGVVDARITATSAQWQAFMAKAPKDFFGEPTEFQRVGPAYVSE